MTDPATPSPASTVVLVRPGPHEKIEIFMNRRPEGMETYAGVYVFPGGRVEVDDGSERMFALSRGLSSAQAQQILGTKEQPPLCLAYWVAAVRELFEEAGIHFFMRREDGQRWVATEGRNFARLSEKRKALQRGEINFCGLLESEQLYCDLSGLTYFFHRVTPEHYPIRFDTRFYLAALPPEQRPLHYSEEVAESLWVTAKDALDRAVAGKFPMMPPTLAVLRTLAEYRSWQSLCAAFRLGQFP